MLYGRGSGYGLGAHPAHHPLFFHPRTVSVWLKEIEDKYGLKRVSCHGLRHTYCSFLLSQNVPLQTVSRYMGHSDSAVTLKVYSHFMPETQNQALDALNCIFG